MINLIKKGIAFITLLAFFSVTNIAYAANTHSIDLELSSSQYLSITDGDQTGLDITGDLTIETWIKLESDASGYIVNKWGKDEGYAFTYVNSGTGLRLRINDGTGTTNAIVAWTPSTATWYHIAVAYDASAGTADFYVNGSQQGVQQGSLKTSINDNAKSFVIGINYDDGDNPNNQFDGLIDEVRVWSDVRTPTEISDNYQKELAGNEAGLVGYWKLNNSLLDETSNDNDLTNNNSATFTSDVPFVGAVRRIIMVE